MAAVEFVPHDWHITLATREPALRVVDGDSVVTTTVDAAGYDEHGEQVAGFPNAQTGPFYVEGAEPGDTLCVQIEHLWPNRTTGHSSSRLAPHLVDAYLVFDFPPSTEQAQWELDLVQGFATLASPQCRLGRFSLPFRPMLGCLGVAPPDGQAISTATSGQHGGNMDYKRIEADATIYFPVFVPGALFHLGDGHAVQGDGEIVGTGIEVSMDVRFTVRVLKGKPIRWPRAENATHIAALGNARPLDQALQHATTEMARWLQEEYGLDQVSAHLLLGMCAEYEVANVVDPAYTMVCKVAKSVLSDVGNRPGNE